ncbi:MAG: hypothetical protein ACJ795_02690 [Ktedonobacteraceae bacterium]
MDAVQFGRWISERRRACGWQSQRTFIEAIRQDALLRGAGISEDFLSRLEAGHLSHPFKGTVRRRVLALAWLLCQAPRDIKAYLRAAELTNLNTEETEQIEQLKTYLATPHTPSRLLLPPRPARLIGQASALSELLNNLSTSNVCAITGMPGIGKSALAYEALHQMAANERECLRLFPDGIATFTGTGRRGIHGCVSLLHEIAAVFHTPASKQGRNTFSNVDTSAFEMLNQAHQHALEDLGEADLAYALDLARLALANKRALLLIDDLDANFPLRQALDVLLTHDHVQRGYHESAHERRVVLITSRFIPPPALVASHIHLAPLQPEDAYELFANLLRRSLAETERVYVHQLCAAVGYLPLAIEAAATAVLTEGIPLALLAARVAEYPLDRLLDSEHEIRAKLSDAFKFLEPSAQKRFILLSALRTPSFGLECAAALYLQPAVESRAAHVSEVHARVTNSVEQVQSGTDDIPLAQLASTAADMGQFVRYSLLDLVANETTEGSFTTRSAFQFNGTRYALHPLLRAYAQEHLQSLNCADREAAQRNAQDYALAYVERYREDVQSLEREREFLVAALAQARKEGQHEQVVRFVSGLSHIDSRLGKDEEGERMLRWGIHSSRQLQNQYYLARFLNRLGGLFCHRGEFNNARKAWEEALAIAESLGDFANLWKLLFGLAHIAYHLGDSGAAKRYTEAYLQRIQDLGDPNHIATAIFKRSFYGRILGKKDSAYDDLSLCMRFMSFDLTPDISGHERIFEKEVQLELARIQGNYTLSQQHAAEMIVLIQSICDYYSIVDVLYDQACFARQQGYSADARSMALRAADMAKRIEADHLHQRSLGLLQ